MLSPEVWTFPPPKSNYKERSGNFITDKGIYKPNEINNFYYNHMVSVVLPDTVEVPKHIREALSTDCEYYKIENFSLASLLDKLFLDKFVTTGKLTLLSINTKIDVDDCACVTPDGMLVLSLTKQVFEELGLPGKVSHFTYKTKDRYIVHLNIKTLAHTDNPKQYQRTLQCLNNLEKIDVILSWVPEDEEICPSSIAKYLSIGGYDVRVCTPQYKTRTDYQVKIPVFLEPPAESCEGTELVEWLGMFILMGDDSKSTVDDSINTYQVPEPNVRFGQVRHLEWRGFFTCDKIEKLYNDLAEFVQKDRNIPWISMYVQGFSDSPVAWGLQEHHYFTNGDNAYVIFLQPSEKFMMATQKCTNKRHN